MILFSFYNFFIFVKYNNLYSLDKSKYICKLNIITLSAIELKDMDLPFHLNNNSNLNNH